MPEVRDTRLGAGAAKVRAFGLAGAALLVLAGFFGAAAESCSVYDRSLLLPGDDASVPQGSGVGWWSGKGSDGCFTAGMPTPSDRPAPVEGASLPPIYLAIRSMRIGSLNAKGELDQNAWKDLGFDIDGTCTGSATCPQEEPKPSCKAATVSVPTDGNYCRDNTFGRLEYQATTIKELGGKYGLSDDAFNCALCIGAYNFVIRVSDYNGKGDDDRVRVDMYPSPGLDKVLPWDCASGDWKNHPCFTQDMPFLIREDSMAQPRGGPDLGDSKIFDDQAYVRQGYIVFTLPSDTLFWFPGTKAPATAYPLRLQSGVVTGRLARASDGTWGVTDGVIAGRVKRDDIIRGFRLIGVCEQDPNYGLLNTFVNNNLDVLASGDPDPSKPCDAMSVGLGYVAVQATPGRLEPVADPVECAVRDAGADAREDAGADAPVDASGDVRDAGGG
jgi:hypothetical protein